MIEIVTLPASWLSGHVRVVAHPLKSGNLSSPLNFARFYLPRLLPALDQVLYLDADVALQSDVHILWKMGCDSLHSLHLPAAAVPAVTDGLRYSRYVSSCGRLFADRYNGTVMNATAETFNAGVMFFSLRTWDGLRLTDEAEWWMAKHNESPGGLWYLGSQPILHLILYGRWAKLPLSWNVDGLGWRARMAPELLSSAKLLHWSGRHKPWLPDGLYRDLFPLNTPKASMALTLCQREVWHRAALRRTTNGTANALV